jgi:hypothetical protein
MHRSHLLARAGRRSLAILAGAVLAVAGLASGANADSRPAVDAADPIVTGSSVTLDFTVNRATNSIQDAACSLTDPSQVSTVVSCGESAPGPLRRSTEYRTTLTGLAPGDYVYDVSITLTDGGAAAASRSFTIEQTAPVEFAASATACQALPGATFVAHESWWQVWSCSFDAATSEAGAAASAGLAPLCLADGGIGFSGGLVGPGRYEASCWLT